LGERAQSGASAIISKASDRGAFDEERATAVLPTIARYLGIS